MTSAATQPATPAELAELEAFMRSKICAATPPQLVELLSSAVVGRASALHPDIRAAMLQLIGERLVALAAQVRNEAR